MVRPGGQYSSTEPATSESSEPGDFRACSSLQGNTAAAASGCHISHPFAGAPFESSVVTWQLKIDFYDKGIWVLLSHFWNFL